MAKDKNTNEEDAFKAEVLNEIKNLLSGDKTIVEVHISPDGLSYSCSPSMKGKNGYETKTRYEIFGIEAPAEKKKKK